MMGRPVSGLLHVNKYQEILRRAMRSSFQGDIFNMAAGVDFYSQTQKP